MARSAGSAGRVRSAKKRQRRNRRGKLSRGRAVVIERRRRNRRYMRIWRANPVNHAQELARAARRRVMLKLSVAERPIKPYTNLRGELVCGFCMKGAPVERVARLRILKSGEFQRICVPYCGQC